MYKVLIKDQKANVNGLETIEVKDGKVEVLPLSSLVLVKDEVNDSEIPGGTDETDDSNVNEYTITFDLNGGKYENEMGDKFHYSYNESEEIELLPKPVRNGYDFEGWELSGKLYEAKEKIVVNSDMIFTAKWNEVSDIIVDEDKNEKDNKNNRNSNNNDKDKGNKNNSSVKPNPSTGDNGILIYVGLILLAVVIFIIIKNSKKKK